MAVIKLSPGEEYLRDTSEQWTEEIVKSMERNPFVKGAPLVAIVVDATKDEFNKDRVSTVTKEIKEGESVVAAILPSQIEVSYCTPGKSAKWFR